MARPGVAQPDLVAPFTRITTGPVASDLNCAFQGLTADYDRDGDLDLCVSGFAPGRTAFYRNDGGTQFTRVTDTNALPFLAMKDSFPVWADYDNDGLPDLAVLADFDYATFEAKDCRTFRNNGDGTFSFGSKIPNNWGWSAAWGDIDHDGFLDFLIPQVGSRPPMVLRNDGRGGLTRMTAQELGGLGVSVAWAGGLSCADYNDDGWLDVLIARTHANLLFRGTGNGRFNSDARSRVNWTTAADPIAGAWGDFDNDGRLDLLLANVNGQGPNGLATPELLT